MFVVFLALADYFLHSIGAFKAVLLKIVQISSEYP